ncbi:glucosamine-6-phosphate deaminase [Salinispirillum sp. LH 10-3-1]|uniref:Glucosamine-6-phosphate deaminase n=1 Tax=Salinispirillum sp. LH 10-3-1 TaxID=2952525 RepID=A0AB38YHL1_9GAMM
MQVVILPQPFDVAQYAADFISKQIRHKPSSVLGLATGSTPIATYQALIELVRQGAVSFQHVHTFNLDEYLGIPATHPQSYRHFMNEELFNHIDIDVARTQVPDGMSNDPIQACTRYEQAIQDAGGIDLQLLGLGRNGHIGFNEPSSSLASRTRIKTLTPATVADNARFFAPGEFQPHLSITMGIGTIMEARKILLLATGDTKASAVKTMVEGALSAACPATILQMHPQATVVLDSAAASLLEMREFYQYIEHENQKLQANGRPY